jgi:uncharacterized protein
VSADRAPAASEYDPDAVPRPLVVLLPPSVGKADGGRGRYSPDSGRFSAFADKRVSVLAALVAAVDHDPEVAAKLFGATGPLLDRAVRAIEQLDAGTAASLPAWRRYTGVVWEHLDPATLTTAQRGRIIVPSALLGVTTGTDPVPDHRLSFGVSVPGLGKLDRWWRLAVTEAIVKRTSRAPIVDLLPKEHAEAIDMDALASQRRLVIVRFRSADGARSVGHDAKAVKGVVARIALRDGIDAIPDLRWRGWTARRDDTGIEVTAPR